MSVICDIGWESIYLRKRYRWTIIFQCGETVKIALRKTTVTKRHTTILWLAEPNTQPPQFLMDLFEASNELVGGKPLFRFWALRCHTALYEVAAAAERKHVATL